MRLVGGVSFGSSLFFLFFGGEEGKLTERNKFREELEEDDGEEGEDGRGEQDVDLGRGGDYGGGIVPVGHCGVFVSIYSLKGDVVVVGPDVP